MDLKKNYLNTVKALRAKVVDDSLHAELIQKLPREENWRIIKRSDVRIQKLSQTNIELYEKRYRAKVPEFVKYLLTELGQSPLICMWFIDTEKIDLWQPTCYLSEEFFLKCIHNGISQEQLDTVEDHFNLETNTFSDQDIQRIYEQLGCDDEKHMAKLLYTGHGHCGGAEYVILNRLRNGEV